MRAKIFMFIAVGIALCFGLSFETYAQQKVIKMGVTAALQKEAGIGSKNASEMAANEINAMGGILGHKIELFFADDEGIAEKGVTAIKKLLFTDKVDFISGGWMSGVGLAQAAHIFDGKKLWLSSGPATPKLAKMVEDNYEQGKYFFRVGCVNSDLFAYDMAIFAEEFFKKELKVTKIALLPESTVWAREMSTYLEKELPKRGLKIVYRDVFDPKRTDFSPQFAQIRAKGAQLLLTVQAASPGVPITNQWSDTKLAVHQAGYSLNSQVTDFWDKTGGKCNYEATQLINGARAPITPKSIAFYDQYVKTYSISPTYTAWGQYDAFYLLKAAAEEAKSLDTEVLIKTLEKMRFVGAAGVISFEKNHDLKYGQEGKQPIWAQWQDGKHVVIFPKQYASGKYISPPWLKKKK
ncbi:MAG: ABC transporter substrate-binding protein [Proteobacteria bacterium]|nr:ABC transporter substrate-binding protein [Pseudomonadota bacterium]